MKTAAPTPKPLLDVKGFPPPWEHPSIPFEILPYYLAYHGYESVGMDSFSRLIVQPKAVQVTVEEATALRLAEAAEVAK